VAESDASGEASVDDAVDEPIGTDWLVSREPNAPDASAKDDEIEHRHHESGAQQAPHGFDAFNANTWHFKPAPTPWYRTRQAVGTIVAVVIAVVALVVSVVLLVVHGSPDDENVPATDSSTAPTSTVPTMTTSAVPPPLPPAPPPPPPPVAENERPPLVVRQPPSPTKPPEFGVTRTPVTRSPISVSPQRPSGR
jgi:hypothetical protein